MFGITSQLRRAVVSITCNIAEGFYRRTSDDKNHFYYSSLASSGEVHNLLLISKDLGYISNKVFIELVSDIFEIQRLLNGLIKTSSTRYYNNT